jgi:hypothetical protein
MQAMIGAIVLATGLGFAGVSSPAGTPVNARGPQETLVEQVQYDRGGYCERLRRACIYKEERGEVGEGNCRRYRAECGGRVSYCERLLRQLQTLPHRVRTRLIRPSTQHSTTASARARLAIWITPSLCSLQEGFFSRAHHRRGRRLATNRMATEPHEEAYRCSTPRANVVATRSTLVWVAQSALAGVSQHILGAQSNRVADAAPKPA